MGASKCNFLEEEESKGSTTSSKNTNSKNEKSPENDLTEKIVVVTDLKNVDIILSDPSSYPNSDTTPTFTVINLNSGDTVKLYSGDNCDSMTNGFATVGPNQDSIQITLSDINGFDEKSISGKVTNEQGNESNCTNNLISYQVENPVSGLMSSNISLSEPTSSTNIDDTPTFLVTDIEEGNTVNIYSGDNCNGDFSGSGIVAAGENSVEITIAPITETGSYSFSATISDHDGNTSNCSGGLINYKLASSSTFISTWKTFSDNEEITIPMVELNNDGSAFTYDYTINWGDGSDSADVTSYDDPDATHVYSDQGEYNVTIIGTMETIKCFGSDSKDNLISIPNLGAVG